MTLIFELDLKVSGWTRYSDHRSCSLKVIFQHTHTHTPDQLLYLDHFSGR